MTTILIIDDEEKLRALMKRIIILENFKVFDVGSIAQAKSLLENHSIDIVLCDVKLPDGNGVEFTRELKYTYPFIEIILLTAYGNIPDGIKAIKNGAFDYIVKGDDNDRIIPLLNRASEKVALQTKVAKLENQINDRHGFDKIIGDSAPIQNAIQLAKKVAPTDAAVLLIGETGTGKEVFAQAIHYNSSRNKQSYVALNCSAFNKDLLESELFGHKAGAFTGAIKDKKGLVEEANNGTLFLDEIGEMPLELQPKLLRLLESGTYMRVGDTKESKVDLRLIAATNRDLAKEAAENQFRNDLFYRIAVFTIDLPALRERQKDIPLLAYHYLNTYARKIGKNIKAFTSEALDILKANNWKGNVRELKNVLERGVILEDSTLITVNSLPLEMQYHSNQEPAISSFELSVIEKYHIKKVLKYTDNNKAEAAKLLNIGIATLYRKIEEYQLKG